MSRMRTVLVLVVASLPIFFDLGGVPLGPRSDGRYAAVARTMAESSTLAGWLVPHFEGEPHLTKPPLTYWAQAALIRLLGPNEWAVRLPSAIAGLAVLLGTFWMGRHIGGRRVGLLAAGVLAVMPLHIVVHRLTLTDGLLAPCWLGVLCAAYLAVEQPERRRWPMLLWAAVAVGWLVKGPIVLIALGVVVAWLVVGRRADELRPLRWGWGLPLSLVPITLWAAAVWRFAPEAVEVWREEVIGRVGGGGEHPQGVWYFFVVLLVGMFPATCMLNLPLNNYPWRLGFRSVRDGEAKTLWAWAIVLPLVVFSIPSGKLATYLLPVAPPLALLTAMVLQRWLNGSSDAPPPGVRPPDVRHTCLAVTALATVGLLVTLIVAPGVGVAWALPFVLVPISAAMMQRIWRRNPALRAGALRGAWVTLVAAVCYGELTVPRVLPLASPWPMVRTALADTPGTPAVVTYGYRDYALSFYLGYDVPRTDEPHELAAALEAHGRSLVVAVEVEDWQELAANAPMLAARFATRGAQAIGERESRAVLTVQPAPAPAPRDAGDQSPPASPSPSAGSKPSDTPLMQ